MHKEISFIGLGRMGAAMAAHLVEKGYKVHGYDTSEEARAKAAGVGVLVHDSIEDVIVGQMGVKLIWIMVPSRHVDEVIGKVRIHLKEGDVIIDGGNSFFLESINRHQDLRADGLHLIDCGTSGGVDGARNGASLMVGGDAEVVSEYDELFTDLAIKDGYGHVGGPGAGHFVKMVHNGIEYGMMGAIAEGINVLDEHREGLDLDISEALKPYQHGSIIESNLMDWLVDAYKEPRYLDKIAGSVPEGETEMEMEYLANHEEVRVLDAALLQRKLTRLEPSFIGTLISAMRNQFGGHAINEKKKHDANKKK